MFRRSKYGAVRSNGKDSKKEAKYINTLQLLEKAGEITDLQTQVVYILLPKQEDENGKCLERSLKYIADATYYDKEGVFHCVDVKGFRTKEYKIKKKLMLYFHKIRIEEV